MKRFPDNSRVVFIGDSITAGATWIAHILDRYVAELPRSRVYMYGAGISGGSARSAMLFMDSDTLIYEPTHAVIMLGMNDIGRGSYCAAPTEAQLQAQKASMAAHKEGMTALAGRLSSLGIQLTFLTPTPYDEGMETDETCYNGCAGALEECGRFASELAERFGGEVIDFNGPMTAINRELQRTDPKLSLIGPDRVHPLHTCGHSAMARLFLAAQGFDIVLPTASGVLNGSVCLDMSPKAAGWLAAHGRLERLRSTEWLLLQKYRGRTADEKNAFLKEYLNAGSFPSPFWKGIARNYYENSRYAVKYLVEHVRSSCDIYN